MMRGRRLSGIILAVLTLGVTLAACDLVDAPPNPDEPAPAILTTTTTPPPTTTTTERVCTVAPPEQPVSASGTLVEQAVAISRTVFDCADRVALTRPSAYEAVAPGAAAMSIPLLVWDPNDPEETLAEIERLDPTTLVLASPTISVPVDIPSETAAFDAEPEPSRVWITSVAGAGAVGRYGALLAGAHVIGLEIGQELSPEQLELLRGADELVLPDDLDPTVAWQLENLRAGVVTVSGTPNLFENTRFVAFYGNPTTSALGVLGEQGPQASIERLAPIVEEYAADGRTAIPTFEIIMTVADAVPGDDGDYSAEMDPALARPWIDAATAAGGYVILDLQPGRTDFLTQAMRYEELLRLPNVGLALDPEWRLEPDEFHLRQIGSVETAEIDLVTEWLAGIVRDEGLPQKMFLLHQFRFDMIPDRADIILRPELATIVQMDGQGPLGTKYDTFDALTGAPDADRYAWGWKNFYDEDSPMATAAQVLVLDPLPVLVTFQ